MIKITHDGNFKKSEHFLNGIINKLYLRSLDKYGQEGVEALSAATPRDSGKTAESWSYEIHYSKDLISITWINSNTNKGVNIAVLIQYGHGTRNGGYVKGRDFINPAIRPVFDKIADSVWKEVQAL